MIKVLRDRSCPNTLDCNKVYGLGDGRRAVRGDKPDATVLAELGPLPDHEGVVIVEPELFPEVREVLPYSAAPLVALAELLWNQATDFTAWWAAHPSYHRDNQAL
ncbi:MAG: hypothetical protein ACRDRY_21440 [Pseudonocardiaceae bacterium]